MRQKLKMPLIAVCLCLTGAGTANAQWVVSDPGKGDGGDGWHEGEHPERLSGNQEGF